MNKVTKIYLLSGLALALVVLGFVVITPKLASAEVTSQTTFSNSDIYLQGDSRPVDYNGWAAGYYPDDATATRICQIKGYDTLISWTPQYRFYDSCWDNYMYKWTGSSGTYIPACTQNTGIDTVTCGKNPACTSHASKQCLGTTVAYWYDSCGTRQEVYQQCTSNQTCVNGACTAQNIACSSNSDCGNNEYTGSPFCQYGNVYQNYKIWTCNNAGTANSKCAYSDVPQLRTSCTGNQTCTNGSCGNSCTQNSYQRCVGSNLYWYDSCNNQQINYQYCTNGCDYDRCTNQTNGSLSVNRTVKNITTGSGFATTTYASPGDMLMFMITLQASGQDVQNVFVRDTLSATLIYNNQLVVACTANGTYNNNCNNNVWNYSGDIISGMNLNTISNGQTVTVTYQVQVAGAQNFAFGSTTLSNNVTVTATNNNNIPFGNASVIVTRSAVAGASTINTGLTDNPFVDSFILPLIITLAGLWMWKSGMFLGIEKRISNLKSKKNTYSAEKELSSRISEIRQTEKGLI